MSTEEIISLNKLHALLESNATLDEIDTEVRRLCMIALVIGTERGIAHVIAMNKADDDTPEVV